MYGASCLVAARVAFRPGIRERRAHRGGEELQISDLPVSLPDLPISKRAEHYPELFVGPFPEGVPVEAPLVEGDLGEVSDPERSRAIAPIPPPLFAALE